MVGTTDQVLYAAIAFVGIHIASSTPLRAAIVGRLGEGVFRGLFSLISLLLFGWLIWAYVRAPFEPVWLAPPWVAWIPLVVMPFAMILLVAGITTRNPMAAGLEARIDDRNPAPGILTITRHPLFWGIGLWALVHIPANGDMASLYFFGALGLLAFGGMPLIDKKKEETLGAHWGPFAMRTSAVPFLAIGQRRTVIDWRGIGWWRPALGIAFYAVLLGGHAHLFGVRPFPF